MGFLIVLLLCLLIIVTALVFMGNSNSSYKQLAAEYGNEFQLSFLAPASLFLLDKTNIMKPLASLVQQVHEKIIRVYGINKALSYTHLFFAQVVSSIILTLLAFTFIAVAAGEDLTLFIFGVCVLPVVAFVSFNDLNNKVKARQQDMLIELPEFLNKIVLLVDAGETIQEAIIRSAEAKKDETKNPLYYELLQSVNELKINKSFEDVLENFNKRCSIPEVSIFTTTVLLNYRRGGETLVSSLRKLLDSLWEKRKSIARTQGEEASSKLVFPMVLIFLVVTAIVAAPALMTM